MPKYKISYAFDCPCYGHKEIEAASPEDAAEKAKRMFAIDTLVNSWNPEPESGCENYRVISIADERDEVVNDGFDLEP